MRTPPPGDITASDAALTELRRRLSTDPDETEQRRARYWAAMTSDANAFKVDAVMRLADEEHGDLRRAVERGLDLANVWEATEPHSLMSRRRAAAILREVLS